MHYSIELTVNVIDRVAGGGLDGGYIIGSRPWPYPFVVAAPHYSSSNLEVTVFSDSQYALKALKSLGQDSGQFLVGSIASLSHGINSSRNNVKVCFQWCLALSKIPGNEIAHKLAPSATEKGMNIHLLLNHFQRYALLSSKRQRILKILKMPQVFLD